MVKEDTLTLMTAERAQRSLERMAHEINEQNRSNYPLLLLGINQRGLVIAGQLAKMLSEIIDKDVQTRQVVVKENQKKAEPWKPEEEKTQFIVIVDDVIFSGQTMFQALKGIDDFLNPDEIHTAVLIDRGHRKYPIKAEFYGMELPTKLDEHVTVRTGGQRVQEVQLIHE